MKLNFKTAYDEYLIYISSRQKVQSIRTLIGRFNNKILPYFKDYNIQDITKKDYLKWQYEIYQNNYSNNYNKNLHYIMCSFFEYCVSYYNLKSNVAREVGLFKKKNEIKKYDFYTLKEFKHFIKYVDNIIYKEFFYLMFFTGTRPGEAMALKFSDITNKYISINKTIDEHYFNGIRNISSPKTFTSIRNIAIDKWLYKQLMKLKKLYDNLYHIENCDYFVFGGLKPLSPTTINRHKQNACKKAKIRLIKLHEFRHSHATLLVNSKIMINEVSRRLGHSNTSITLDTYVHSDLRQEKRVLRTLKFLRLFL